MAKKFHNPIEDALMFERLRTEGKNQTQIACETNQPQSYVSIMLQLLKLPRELRDQVAGGSLKISVAIVLVRRCSSQEDMIDVMRELGRSSDGKKPITKYILVQYLNRRDQIDSFKTTTHPQGSSDKDKSAERMKSRRHKRTPQQQFMYELLASTSHLAVLLEKLVQSQNNEDEEIDVWTSVPRAHQQCILEYLSVISRRSHHLAFYLQRRAAQHEAI